MATKRFNSEISLTDEQKIIVDDCIKARLFHYNFYLYYRNLLYFTKICKENLETKMELFWDEIINIIGEDCYNKATCVNIDSGSQSKMITDHLPKTKNSETKLKNSCYRFIENANYLSEDIKKSYDVGEEFGKYRFVQLILNRYHSKISFKVPKNVLQFTDIILESINSLDDESVNKFYWGNFVKIYNSMKYKMCEIDDDLSYILNAKKPTYSNTFKSVDLAFQKYFKSLKENSGLKCGLPRYKTYKDLKDSSMYFCRLDKQDNHLIKITPDSLTCNGYDIGTIRLLNEDYVPVEGTKGFECISATIKKRAGRYFISVVVNIDDSVLPKHGIPTGEGIGINVGIKELVTLSDGRQFTNINKLYNTKRFEEFTLFNEKFNRKIVHMRKSLKRLMRSQSRMIESFKCDKKKDCNIKYSDRKNLAKIKLEIQKLNLKIDFSITEYLNQIVDYIVNLHPTYVTVETLNIAGMKKNKHLSKHISEANWYKFTTKLISKCLEYGIEVRKASPTYPSTQTCSCCGNVLKNEQKINLGVREYKCSKCGMKMDRDVNAAINLKLCQKYTVVSAS